jgi:hypothetical protein
LADLELMMPEEEIIGREQIMELYHKAFVFEADGHKLMIATCKKCGAAVMESENTNAPIQHWMWHQTVMLWSG